MPGLNEIYSFLCDKFPLTDAQEWDNCGLLVSSEREISSVTVALDASTDVINGAIDSGCELVISHHPIIFHPLTHLDAKNPAVYAAKNDIAVISMHTNFDVSAFSADAELSTQLSKRLEFCEQAVLDVTRCEPLPCGFGRYGSFPYPISPDCLATELFDILMCDNLRFVNSKRNIKKLAFCCGGGSEYFERAVALGCGAYITADVKHSTFTEAKNFGVSLFAPTHYQMEKPAIKNLCALLSSEFPSLKVSQSICESEPTETI